MQKLINGSMQNVSRSGEMVESRIHYVGIQENMLMCSIWSLICRTA